jgi:DNA repair exonuclease SbcCD ATPase subunit
MIFKKLYIEGFRSIQSLTIDFDQKGVCFVRGENGSGKSTIFEALFWGLYGKTVKNTLQGKIAPYKEYRSPEYKGTKVVLELVLDSGQTVTIDRNLDYGKPATSELFITVDGVQQRNENKIQSQVILENYLNIGPELFSQSIFFAQKSLRLVDKSDADKRDILDAIFDVSMDDYLAEANNELTKLTQESQALTSQIAGLDYQIGQLITRHREDSEILKNFDEQQKTKIDTINLEKQGYETQLNALKKQITLVELVPPDKVDQTEKVAKERRINAISMELGALNHIINIPEIGTLCLSCDQPLKADKIKPLQDQRKEKIDKALNDKNVLQIEQVDIELWLKEFSVKNSEYAQNYADYTTQTMEQNKQKFHITQLESSIANCDRMLSVINSTTCPVTQAKLDQYSADKIWIQTNHKTLSEKLVDINGKIELYKFWATTGFTSKGMKAYVMHAMLAKLNIALETYGKMLGIYVSIDVKLDQKSKSFAINITSPDGVSKTYSDLSGGEQKRVDLIVSFALYDIVTANKVKPSLIVMDEVFEGLDEFGLDTAMQIIQQKANNCAVYIITHSINVDTTMAKILDIKKDKHATYLG